MIEKQLNLVPSPDPDSLHRNSDVPRSGDLRDAGAGLREAGVLIPLIQQSGDWHVLFIRRAQNERDRHSGQVAFPGGARDAEDDTLVATALRETHEEIGVSADRIKLLGELGHYYTVSHYRVTPVVGIMRWPSNLRLEESEVARAFLIPLNWLRDSNNFTLRARSTMDPQGAREHPIIVFNPYDGETLWGATARMTMNFIKALDDGDILLPADA